MTVATKAPRGRPLLFTSYPREMSLFPTTTRKVAFGVLLAVTAVLPFMLADAELQLLATCCIAAIGAIGLGLVTGYAGQVSLGHAFFLGIGAYTASVISGDPDGRTVGFGVTNILRLAARGGPGRRAGGRHRGTAGHPAARALPGDRHARPGLHRPTHLQRVVERHGRRRRGAARADVGDLRLFAVHHDGDSSPATRSCSG